MNLPARQQVIDASGYSAGDRGFQHTGYPAEMEEPDHGGLIEYWRILRRRKGTLILISGLGLLLAVLVTLPQTPVYQAKTTLEILELNQDFMNMKNVQQVADGGTSNLMTDIQTQIKILQSESLLDRVVASFKAKEVSDLGRGKSRISAWRRALNLPEPSGADAQSAALKMAQRDMKVRASGQTRIVEILVDSTDPRLATDFANRLTQEYIEQNMDARWKMSQRTGEFLSKQIDEMRVKLERSEDALQVYARRNGLLFSDDKTNVTTDKLKQVQESLTKAQTDRVQKQSRWEMATTAPSDTLPDVLDDKTLQEYETRLTDLRRQKAEFEETYTSDNPKVKRVEAQIVTVTRRLERQRTDILKRIKNEYDEALRREKLLEADYRQQAGLVTDQGDKAITYNILKRESDTNRQLYDSMLQRVKESAISSALKASNVRVVDPAKIPTKPYKPSFATNAALGLVTGLFLGVAFVVMTDRANRTLTEPADIAYYLNVPELGMIPAESSMTGKRMKYFGRSDKKKDDSSDDTGDEDIQRLELVTYQRKPSLLAESFRATLTSILFTGQDGRRPKLLVVTSPSPGEGKTTVVTNLAIALAETGQRVLLIDADTRKPRIHSIFGLVNERGLTTILRGNNHNGTASRYGRPYRNGDSRGNGRTNGVAASAFTGEVHREVATELPGDEQSLNGAGGHKPALLSSELATLLSGMVVETKVDGLYVLPSGPGVAGATNLLYSQQLPELLEHLQDEFDMIFIDTPPMLQIPDARVIGRLTSGVVLVVRANQTTRDAAIAARGRLRDDGIHVVGTVLNDWNPKQSPGGYYGYYDGHYGKYYKRYYGPTTEGESA
ncbi:polysaccharide biosynthesis tyrosine autokinase [Paludibaculum fermentans]|uniref:Polysaccharide biosynthesis tyrosine autokinase n=1 Tax=Paludibaculum fermentans TaxID=1473598 RepID=A0A7S7NK68_PALFE|nr:polysaccharide biosynthesis tyrosine autokinase [Paludibaculum fermentans]QOY85107.1 polysaccharide biosynthesis tyrosine autokinase [Paludibaculum fermentans]